MAFDLHGFWVWDFWIADDGDLFHLFYLHAPVSLGDANLRHRNAVIGHATSADLTSWTNLGPVLGPGSDEQFDRTATWTGSVIAGPDGLWRMYYTGASFYPDHNIETIGVALSDDLHTWTKAPGPIVQADSRWYERYGDSSWPEEAWRDPWVFRDEAGSGWHMLVTARSSSGPDDERGVVGHAWSADLQSWAITAPLSEPGSGFAHLEVPQLATVQGQRVLIFSCDTTTLSAKRRESDPRGGVWSVPAPNGVNAPFDIARAQLVTSEPIYSGRLVQSRDGSWVLLGFRHRDGSDEFGGGIIDPLPVIVDADGYLRLR